MLKGCSYDQIAREVGYANRGTAHRVVAKALAERLADDIDQLRELELARLDGLQTSLWPRPRGVTREPLTPAYGSSTSDAFSHGPVRVQGSGGAATDPGDRPLG